MINYVPTIFDDPKCVQVTSAWEPMRPVIKDIIKRFKLGKRSALEFGVERGYSTTVLANYFSRVLGVDPFNWTFGDGADRGFDAVKKLIAEWQNILLIQALANEFTRCFPYDQFDLIHIDIGYETHCYETTMPAAEWAVRHSKCVLLHDIFSFPEIDQVCKELAAIHDLDYYGYSEPIGAAGVVCGLGILIRK